MATYEYKTEVLTAMMGRDKLRIDDLEDTLQKFGADDIRSSRDGHLLIFKRQTS